MFPVNFKTSFYFSVRSGEFILDSILSDLKSMGLHLDKISSRAYSLDLDSIGVSNVLKISPLLSSYFESGVSVVPYTSDAASELALLLETCSELIIREV